jgi:mRNA interferase YafQ
MYKIVTTKRFEKEVMICIKRGFDISHLKEVMKILEEKGSLPQKYKSHKLSGNYSNCWECHIKPNWLLVWQQNKEDLILLFLNTGTHSDLFK